MNLAPQYSGSIYSYPSPDFFNKIGQQRTLLRYRVDLIR
jgi:hypothetical protein